VLTAALLAAACVLVTVGLIWTVRRVRIGGLDAMALTEIPAAPHPRSALDWPELRVRAVVPQPDGPALVLVVVGWPAYPNREATLLLAIQSDGPRSLDLLEQWRDASAPVSPVRRGELCELRRRQSLELVRGLLIAEDAGGTGLDRRCRS
jgi:hypothetical protein